MDDAQIEALVLAKPFQAAVVVQDLAPVARAFADAVTRPAAESVLQQWSDGRDELRKGIASAWLARARAAIGTQPASRGATPWGGAGSRLGPLDSAEFAHVKGKLRAEPASNPGMSAADSERRATEHSRAYQDASTSRSGRPAPRIEQEGTPSPRLEAQPTPREIATRGKSAADAPAAPTGANWANMSGHMRRAMPHGRGASLATKMGGMAMKHPVATAVGAAAAYAAARAIAPRATTPSAAATTGALTDKQVEERRHAARVRWSKQ